MKIGIFHVPGIYKETLVLFHVLTGKYVCVCVTEQ